MSKQTITADHLNATHLGKRVSILDNGEVVMSGTLKKFETRLGNQPVFTSDVCFTPSTVRYETRACIVLHLSNQFNDDIAATVNGDKELRIEEEG